MVVIFGWGSGEAQDHGEVVPVVCPRCHNPVFLHEVQSDRQFSIFFVPLGTYRTDRYLACPICHGGAPVEAARQPAVDSMRTATRSFRTGKLPPEAYRARAQGFLASMQFAGATVPDPLPPFGPPPGARPPHPLAAPPAPAPAAPAPGAPPVAAPSSSVPALSGRLADLAKLHADGVLTDDEFAAAKQRLLES